MNGNNKKIALLCSICMILLSTFFSVRKEYKDMQKQLDAIYYEEKGIHNDLMALAGHAFNVDKIAQRYDISTSSLTTLAFQLKESSPCDAGAIMLQLDTLFHQSCNLLNEADLSEQDRQLLIKQQADFDAIRDIISRSSYHEKVAWIERELSKFPSDLLYKISGSHLEIYKEEIN